MLLNVKYLTRFFNMALIISFVLLPQLTYAKKAAMSETKIKLNQLINKISTLQHTLTSAHEKNKQLNHELADIEKKMGLTIWELHQSELVILSNQSKINELQQEVTGLSDQLHQQQSLLAQHVRARYMMGEYQPLKGLLNQDTPYTTNRILTLYQYVIKSRQKNIHQLHGIQSKLTQSQLTLRQELIQQMERQNQFNLDKTKLESDKRHSLEILHALDNDIENKQHVLKEYQNNKDNLSKLLNSLNLQTILQNQRPLLFAHTKLPQPVNISPKNIEKINQGLVFYTHEGASVTAVYAGKVVFSDWLKGYGLLLIIDHGRGFMTLYAHNQSLFKRKGDFVSQSEQIATVGHSGGIKQNGLYFEIRQHGKAISPAAWLS